MRRLRGCCTARGATDFDAPTSGADRGKHACRLTAHDLLRIEAGKGRLCRTEGDPASAGPQMRVCILSDPAGTQPGCRWHSSCGGTRCVFREKPKGQRCLSADNGTRKLKSHAHRTLCPAPGMGSEQALQHSARCFLSLLRDVQTAAARRPRPQRRPPADSRPSDQFTLEIEHHDTAARQPHGSQSEPESKPLLQDVTESSDGAKTTDRVISVWWCATSAMCSMRRH